MLIEAIISFIFISAIAIATLKIELISKNIFSKAYNSTNQDIKDIINIGSYEDIISLNNLLIIRKDLILIDNHNVKFLQISLKENNASHYSKFRMFYGK